MYLKPNSVPKLEIKIDSPSVDNNYSRFVQNEDVASLLSICRVCLATDVKNYCMSSDELAAMFQRVTGIQVNAEDKLPRQLCWECVGRLSSANNFVLKAAKTNWVLLNTMNTGKLLSMSDIESIDRSQLGLVSTLSIKFNKESDVHIIEETSASHKVIKSDGISLQVIDKVVTEVKEEPRTEVDDDWRNIKYSIKHEKEDANYEQGDQTNKNVIDQFSCDAFVTDIKVENMKDEVGDGDDDMAQENDEMDEWSEVCVTELGQKGNYNLDVINSESTKGSTTEVQTIKSRKTKKTNAQKCREYRERKKLQNSMVQHIPAERSDGCSETDRLQAKRPKTNAERRKKHYEAQKLKKQQTKKIPKTAKQRNKEYYERKKLRALNALNHHSDARSKAASGDVGWSQQNTQYNSAHHTSASQAMESKETTFHFVPIKEEIILDVTDNISENYYSTGMAVTNPIAEVMNVSATGEDLMMEDTDAAADLFAFDSCHEPFPHRSM